MAESTRLALDGEMTIYNAVATKEKLLAALAAAQELELDLGQVAEIDTAGCQLLILAKREATRLGKSLHLVAHSAAVLDVLNFYNVAAFFGDPLVIPANEAA